MDVADNINDSNDEGAMMMMVVVMMLMFLDTFL